MSEIFLVNMQYDSISYDALNSLANEITAFALKNNLGVHFNEFWDSLEVIRKKHMKNYFFISDSFLHCNASFLDIATTTHLVNLDYKTNFYNNLEFVYEMIGIIEKYDVSNIELYISSDGILDDEKDFIVLNLNKSELLDKLYQTVINNVNEFAYECPPIKINISTISNNNC